MNPPNVAALYVERKGPYFSLLSSRRCWDENRDARTYPGPYPVVAHPPCGPWGRLKGLCTKQDPNLALFAVDQVRLYGGVLAHPAYSGLWRACRLPRPGEFLDKWGGWTLNVDQVDYGHKAQKQTWLYIVGMKRKDFYRSDLWKNRPGPGIPTHTVTSSLRKAASLPKMWSDAARQTPPEFGKFLIEIASRCSKI